MQEFLQQLINGLSVGAIYALIAVGYTMVYGVLQLINFAHGDVFMVGAMLALLLARAFGFVGPAAYRAVARRSCSCCSSRSSSAALLGFLDRAARLPPAARPAAHQLADHRDRRLAAAGVRRAAPAGLRPDAAAVSRDMLPGIARAVHVGGVVDQPASTSLIFGLTLVADARR